MHKRPDSSNGYISRKDTADRRRPPPPSTGTRLSFLTAVFLLFYLGQGFCSRTAALTWDGLPRRSGCCWRGPASYTRVPKRAATRFWPTRALFPLGLRVSGSSVRFFACFSICVDVLVDIWSVYHRYFCQHMRAPVPLCLRLCINRCRCLCERRTTLLYEPVKFPVATQRFTPLGDFVFQQPSPPVTLRRWRATPNTTRNSPSATTSPSPCTN